MRTNLIYALLLLGASACYAAGAVVEYVDNRAMEDVEKPETESNSTTTTPTENPINCSCETIFYDAEQEEGYIKLHPRLQGCEPAECHYKIAPANDSILTMSLLHGYLTEMSVYYYSDTHNDIIVYNNKRGNQNPYHAPENYGFFITIRNSAEYPELEVYKFRRYKKSDLKHFCPEPYVKVNSTVQSLQTVSWPWSGCALRFEKKPDQHPIQLLTSCKQFGLYAEANLPNNSSVYKVQDGTQNIQVMNLPNSSDVSFVSLYYWNTILMDCEIKYMALEYDPCNCSTTSFNLTVDKQMRLTSPGYPDMMCAKIECQYKFEVSEAAPKGMKHAFFVEAVHKTKVRGDSLLFKVDNNRTVDNLNEHQKNISETAIYLGEHLDIAYSASSLFSNDHGFELKVMVINMPDDCHCPTHKTMELASSETFSFSVQPHCPMMRCRFKIPNTELGNDRIFRLHVDYHLPHAREGIVVEGGEVVHSLYGEEETLVMQDLHDTVDFVTNTTVNIAYYRERSEGNFTANDVSNFTLKWNWVTKNECACHSTGPLMALDTSNVLYSPRYPQEYCSNSHCEYRIQAQEGYHVRLNVSFFETEPYSDFVYVFDGENKIPIFRQSGHLKSIPTLETKTRKATVLFTSDASNTDKGFMIQYQAVPDQVVPLGQESSGAYLVVTIVVIILLLLTGALFLLYKKFVKKYLVLQSVENPVFSFSAKQDVVVVLDKE